jgi:hypothetical protein
MSRHRQHRPVELDLDGVMSQGAAIAVTLAAVNGAALLRGGLTSPEINAAAAELDDRLRALADGQG